MKKFTARLEKYKRSGPPKHFRRWRKEIQTGGLPVNRLTVAISLRNALCRKPVHSW
jgi:hypothetical protein